MVTQREVAEHAGVSLSVVSAVVNGTAHTRMSAPTRDRVRSAMEELGYAPNRAARAVRLQRTGMIAVIVGKLDVPIYSPMVRGIYDAAADRGLAVLLGDAEMMRSDGELVARLVSAGTVDGILLRGLHELDHEVVARLTRRPTPLLVLDVIEDERRPWLCFDDRAAAALATRHLIDHGHRRIAFAGGAPANSTRLRYRSYVETLTAAGLEPLPHLAPAFGEASGVTALRQLWEQRPRPTAVVINNVLGAVGLTAAATDLGVRIPAELSVVGVQDMPLADYLRPAVTTVRVPMYDFGVAAAAALQTMIEGGSPPLGLIDLPAPELVRRDSVGPPRASSCASSRASSGSTA